MAWNGEASTRTEAPGAHKKASPTLRARPSTTTEPRQHRTNTRRFSPSANRWASDAPSPVPTARTRAQPRSETGCPDLDSCKEVRLTMDGATPNERSVRGAPPAQARGNVGGA